MCRAAMGAAKTLGLAPLSVRRRDESMSCFLPHLHTKRLVDTGSLRGFRSFGSAGLYFKTPLLHHSFAVSLRCSCCETLGYGVFCRIKLETWVSCELREPGSCWVCSV